jgi:hypothetical protein
MDDEQTDDEQMDDEQTDGQVQDQDHFHDGLDGHDGLDDLDELAIDRELSGADDLLSAQLRELLDPAAGLRERTAQDIDRSLRGRSSLTAALDLLGLGWWTAKALLGDDTADDGGRERRTLSTDPERADPEGEGT